MPAILIHSKKKRNILVEFRSEKLRINQFIVLDPNTLSSPGEWFVDTRKNGQWRYGGPPSKWSR